MSGQAGGDLMRLDLLTCDLAVTNLTLPFLGPWLAQDRHGGAERRSVVYRQQAEVYGRGYALSESHRHILN